MNKQKICIIGIALLILIAGITVVKTIVTNKSAVNAGILHVVFCGEYRIGDGKWQPIVSGEHIKADKGEVILKGTLNKAFPDGEIVEPVLQGEEVALYFNHMAGEVFINGAKTATFDAENPLLGSSACGKQWIVYQYTGDEDDIIEIHLKNPHRFGNAMAIDDFLESMRMYSGADFEFLMENEAKDTTFLGVLVAFVALLTFGAAIFSSLIRLPNSGLMWLIGMVVLFAGCYLIVGPAKVELWEINYIIDTVLSTLCIFLYLFFMQVLTTYYFVGKTKLVGICLSVASGIITGALLIYALLADIKLYDTLGIWAVIQMLICTIFLACGAVSIRCTKGIQQKMHIAFVMTFAALMLDIIGTWQGWWQGAVCSTYVFILLLFISIIIILHVFPRSVVAMMKEKELQAELEKTKTAVMLSQIKPHFLYNSLGAIRELCRQDPEDARTALGTFINYLRGNMDSIQREHNVTFSKELEHISSYLELEKMRFGEDLNIVYDIQETDFYIPPLTVQPLVENAVKHGICSREDGGTLTLRTYRQGDNVIIQVKDDGMGFDQSKQMEKEHVGLVNTRNRLKWIVGGELDIESVLGEGTTVTITINDRKD